MSKSPSEHGTYFYEYECNQWASLDRKKSSKIRQEKSIQKIRLKGKVGKGDWGTEIHRVEQDI